MPPRTCIHPPGVFRSGVHRPAFSIRNLREADAILALGRLSDGSAHENRANFPLGDVHAECADTIHEIPNPFSFRGTTYIAAGWADARANKIDSIRLVEPPSFSMTDFFQDAKLFSDARPADPDALFRALPRPVQLCLATSSTDANDLTRLAGLACTFVHDPSGLPVGLLYQREATGRPRPAIADHDLFEVVANNPHLPDRYKEVMVLRPGVQGESEIVGDWRDGSTHIYEYLRRNSYIPWGHSAANLAEDAIRYSARDLSAADMRGLRHLYYQRTFTRLAGFCGLPLPPERTPLPAEELERLRLAILHSPALDRLPFDASLWGWNYGFDFSPSGYRLHASHQMIHQQFALIPSRLSGDLGQEFVPFSSGDLVADCVRAYHEAWGRDFFADYLQAIRTNTRMDGRTDLEASLVVWEDERVILFVPKAQTSQWEIQLMPTTPVGNVLEADAATRASLDQGILLALRTLAGLGARLVTSIEYSKRFTAGPTGQRLLYSFLPKLPWSMGAFSEAQLRFICGHYPEDFARACRRALKDLAGTSGLW